MKIFELFGFDETKTDMPSYDDMMKQPEYFARAKNRKGSVVMMSPDEYIDKSLKGFQKRNPNISKEFLIKSRTPEIVDEYATRMQAGEKAPTLMLDYSRGFGQEGLHRALAAKKLGIEKIPVMIVSMTRRKDRGSKKASY